MDIQHFRALLLDQKRELEQQMGQIEKESLEAGAPDVEDGVDRANSSEERSATWDLATKGFAQYTEVRAALDRMAQGTYGKCLECGREIEPTRLEAVPWAGYCLEDQAKIEAAEHISGGPTL